jgi:hypothetical protein
VTTIPPILVTATDVESGEQWTWTDACPSIEKGLTGDVSATWTYDFVTEQDRLPPRFAHVTIEDTGGVIWTGRIVRRQPPPTDLCTGPCSLTAEGYYTSLRDVRASEDVKYGPMWDGSSLARTPEDAITHAVSQNAPNVTLGTIDVSGFTLPDTESFQGRPPADVVTSMSGFAAGLATPFVGRVRNGVFTWGPLDLGAKYQVLIADGAIIAPTDDAARLFNHVLILWEGPPAEWPETLSYSQIPTQVTLSVNAGAEVKTPAAALQLAQGLYARLNELELGWSWNFTIPAGTAVELIGSGPIHPYRMDCAQVLRVPDFEPETKYGTKHSSPSQMVITSLRWDGQAGQLTGTCGEIRDQTAFVRKVMYASNFSIGSPFAVQPGTVRTVRDAGKITHFGPFLASTGVTTSTDAVTPGPATSPAIITHGIPSIDTKQQTVHPGVLPPAPPPVVFHDGDPTTSGVKFKIITPPVKAISWTLATSGIQSNYTAVVTRRSNGATIATLNLAGSSEKIDQTIGTPSNPNSTIGLVEADDLLIYTVTTPASSTSVSFVSAGVRTVRHYPNYAGNPHPITGGH